MLSTRTELKDYCLRKLGAPAIEINVADTQVEDRIDEALQVFKEYHFDAVQESWVIHSVTDADVTAGFLEIPDALFAITRVLPLDVASAWFDRSLFDIRYQMHMTDLYLNQGMYSKAGNMAYIYQNQQHLALIDFMFNKAKSFHFNRITNRLYIEDDLSRIKTDYGQIVLYGYYQLDQNQWPKVWDNIWLKKYTTSLIKRQWGNNMKKFNGVQLPGGVTMNGKEVYDEAIAEIKELEEEIRSTNELPCDLFVG